MGSQHLERLRQVISSDQRRCERIELPLKMLYAFQPGHGGQLDWKGPVLLDNIGGEGIGFNSKDLIPENEDLLIRMYLPDDELPAVFIGKVVWAKEDPSAKRCGCREYSYGIHIEKYDPQTEARFMGFISDQILGKYLDESGDLKDI